ncbi:MAG: Uncharacterised protein [Owenweeksia sp. TMED14]|nr:MAG: Uncharacterised protein [Owenweeksia sp. TMED14]
MNNFTKYILFITLSISLNIGAYSQTAMSGFYTVSASVTADFSSLDSVNYALSQSGVSGPVIINIKDGTYPRFSVDSIAGTSLVNTVTFQSDPANTNQAVIEDSSTSSINNYLVYLNGCDYTVFKNLTFNALGISYGTVFFGNSTLTNWTLDGNTLNGSAGTSTSFSHAANDGAPNSKARGSFRFVNNTINNFSRGFQMGGTGYQLGADSIFLDNNIVYATDQGINLYWVKYVEITNNEFHKSGQTTNLSWFNGLNNIANEISYGVVFNNNKVRGAENALNVYTNADNLAFPLFAEVKNNDITTHYRGIYLRGNPDATTGNTFRDIIVENNKITDVGTSGSVTTTGIELVNINIDTTKNGQVRNNMILLGNVTSNSSIRGFYFYHCSNLDINHNTAVLNSGHPLFGGNIYMSASTSTTQFIPTGNDIHNNILVNYNTGSAIHAETQCQPGIFFTSDHNIYFGNSTTTMAYGTVGTGVNTISAWNTLSGGQDLNSIFGDPIFVSASDIHTAGTLADSSGTPLGLTLDFDGDIRSLTNPDIGADEYTPLSCLTPKNLIASNTTSNTADLTWSTNNPGALGYQIRYAEPGSTTYSYGSGTGTSRNLSGLSTGTNYDVSIRETCSVGDTSAWSAIESFSTLLCNPITQCGYPFIMTDAYGDGWNGGSIAIEQKNPVNGLWINMGTATLASGAGPLTAFADLCDGDSARLVCDNPGSFFYEMSFTAMSPIGDTIYHEVGSSTNDGTTASIGQVFAKFIASCPATCPTTDSVVVTPETTCGPSQVTFTASGSVNPTNSILWMDASSSVLGSGTSFTTPVITANTDYYAAVFAPNNLATPYTFGPTTNLTGGFGNYSNGMWFTASQAFILDSVTVISNGLVDFQIRISEGGGSKTSGHSGNELQLTDTINLAAAGTHQVYVGLAVTPGTYFINFDFVSGTPGQLHRSTTGGVYPYTVAQVASIDSVSFGATNSRVYYAYDWVIREGCTGPITTASAIYGTIPSTTLPYLEDFNNGLPCLWSVLDPGGSTWEIIDNYGTSSNLNGSKFAFVDDDGAGSTASATNVKLVSPIFDAIGYDTLTLEFDHYFRFFTGSAGFVEVYDGSTWVQVASFTANLGAWSNPNHQTIDVTAHQNADFQVRFRYDDLGGSWGWFWAVDNMEIDGSLAPCTDVRVEVLTDVYGDEISWEIVDINTGNVMASRGPLNYVNPYNSTSATYVDTICLPDNGTYEFRIEDSFGDGMTNPTLGHIGYYTVDILCPFGYNNVAKLDTSNAGVFNFGGTTSAGFTGGSWDSTVFTIDCIQTSEVTFQVNMNKVTSAFTTPEVNSTFNSFCGNCDAMSDADGDNVWDITVTLSVGDTIEFKYSADNWTIQEALSNQGPCVIQSGQFVNRIMTIPATDTIIPIVCWGECDDCTIDVTLNLNMVVEVANGAIDTNGVHVAGTWQSWDPAGSKMTDPDGDGIYSITFGSATGEDLQYKFINGIDWTGAEGSGDLSACGISDGLGSYNRLLSLGYADTILAPVCFTKCYDCAVSIDEALGSVSLFPNPTTGAFTLERTNLTGPVEVTIIGLHGQLLNATMWDAGSGELNIDLSDLASGIYMVRLSAKEGTRTMRVAVQH